MAPRAPASERAQAGPRGGHAKPASCSRVPSPLSKRATLVRRQGQAASG
eukprot:CAMPEP_0198544306 /NCGR_PEP_ID=MMETSP1462-20131121/60498_1 /TAXON_ID=1333877 /ORGANISM="Brandtodinium nutriculum, Strain RCC3387" /LENGTH=48 /DNA_ID= /DNA_START= /DNA_END= /DNA_ORIENTATION=